MYMTKVYPDVHALVDQLKQKNYLIPLAPVHFFTGPLKGLKVFKMEDFRNSMTSVLDMFGYPRTWWNRNQTEGKGGRIDPDTFYNETGLREFVTEFYFKDFVDYKYRMKLAVTPFRHQIPCFPSVIKYDWKDVRDKPDDEYFWAMKATYDQEGEPVTYHDTEWSESIFEETAMTKHVSNCFKTLDDTNLPDEIFSINGMSGELTRKLYNNLCKLKFENRDTEYLEVGVWKGSTFISSMFGNEHVTGTCIENWSEFTETNARTEFFQNMNRFDIRKYTCIEGDFFIQKFNKIFDIYVYDGNHDETSHSKAIEFIWPHLADEAIVVIDDWNWDDVRKGTYKALPMDQVVSVHEVRFRGREQPRGYWNGVGIFVIKKAVTV